MRERKKTNGRKLSQYLLEGCGAISGVDYFNYRNQDSILGLGLYLHIPVFLELVAVSFLFHML